jgi:hypothetical protein
VDSDNLQGCMKLDWSQINMALNLYFLCLRLVLCALSRLTRDQSWIVTHQESKIFMFQEGL